MNQLKLTAARGGKRVDGVDSPLMRIEVVRSSTNPSRIIRMLSAIGKRIGVDLANSDTDHSPDDDGEWYVIGVETTVRPTPRMTSICYGEVA
ncbi:hypothetical protein [Agrobacterium cavarae]|uniref:hypothetical protein n=1 Tax=Agrobacterium cavarae TaxID=2528239 RepID=UPI002FFA62DD